MNVYLFVSCYHPSALQEFTLWGLCKRRDATPKRVLVDKAPEDASNPNGKKRDSKAWFKEIRS